MWTLTLYVNWDWYWHWYCWVHSDLVGQELGDEQIHEDDWGTIWSRDEDSEIVTMPCTKDDSNNTTTTHEDCEENITFNLEEENNYTKNEVSSIVHEEHMGTKKDVDNTIQDEFAKKTTTSHEEEHMCTKKDVDNTILEESTKNTTTTHEEEHMGTAKDMDDTIRMSVWKTPGWVWKTQLPPMSTWVLRKMCTTSARMSIRKSPLPPMKRSHTKCRTRNPTAPRRYMKILLSTTSHVGVNNEVGNSRGVPPFQGDDVVLLASDDEVPLSTMQKGVKSMKEMISSRSITSTRKY